MIINALGNPQAEPTSAPALAERELVGVAPRLVRDRLRVLERGGVVAISGHDQTGGVSRPAWTLTPAGRELFSLQSVMARIVGHAARLPTATAPAQRDQLLGTTLDALNDPAVRKVLRTLAIAGPQDPGELEALCAPVPRRTLYRRLSVLVDAGAVLRHTTREVPRRTSYELNERWRPAAAILLLSAWWSLRHPADGRSSGTEDLGGILLAVLPSVRVAETRNGVRVRWTLKAASGTSSIDLRATGTRLRHVTDDVPPDAEITGSLEAWASALVNDRREDLQFTGDAAAAAEQLSAVRAAVLAYVR